VALGIRLGRVGHEVGDLSDRGKNLPLQVKWGSNQELQDGANEFTK
jgi:hypothetical protein